MEEIINFNLHITENSPNQQTDIQGTASETPEVPSGPQPEPSGSLQEPLEPSGPPPKPLPVNLNKRGRPSPNRNPRRRRVTTDKDAIRKVLARAFKDHGKFSPTPNNGYARGLQTDKIMAGFHSQGEVWLFVRFKRRILPEIINANEVKHRDPVMLINYYTDNLHFR